MVAGTSGTGSGAPDGEDENEGRLMLPHAPRNIVSAQANPRLATARALLDLTMAFPRTISGCTGPAAKRKTAVGAMTSSKLPSRSHVVSRSILYRPHQRLNLLCLTGSASSHIPGRTISTPRV